MKGIELVTIPAGEFWMGDDDEIFRVYLNEYKIGKYPVTNAEYAVFVSQGYEPPWSVLEELADHPVVGVTWHDAVAYCAWLSEQTGQPYRLPTEAEWEKAARGVDEFEYPWGDEWDTSRCNTHESGIGGTTPVGKYSPAGDSPYDVADMAGNVWEWCSSLFRPYPYDAGDGREDLEDSGDRVLRGGSFYNLQNLVRCACRNWDLPLNVWLGSGFRVCV